MKEQKKIPFFHFPNVFFLYFTFWNWNFVGVDGNSNSLPRKSTFTFWSSFNSSSHTFILLSLSFALNFEDIKQRPLPIYNVNLATKHVYATPKLLIKKFLFFSKYIYIYFKIIVQFSRLFSLTSLEILIYVV